MLSTTLLFCLFGILSPLRASSVIPDGVRQGGTPLEYLTQEHGLKALPVQPSPAAFGLHSNLTLQGVDKKKPGDDKDSGDDKDLDWWAAAKKKGTHCLGCHAKMPKRKMGCEGGAVLNEDFDNAIEAASLINELGEVIPKKRLNYVRYKSAVVWMCSCGKPPPPTSLSLSPSVDPS